MSEQDTKPAIKPDPLYQMLRHEDVDAFNANRDDMDTSHLKSGDYRGRDLRKLNARGLDFSRQRKFSGIHGCPCIHGCMDSCIHGSMVTWMGEFFPLAKIFQGLIFW